VTGAACGPIVIETEGFGVWGPHRGDWELGGRAGGYCAEALGPSGEGDPSAVDEGMLL
jgi:hypothetical protein